MKSWDTRLTGRGSGSARLSGAGLVCFVGSTVDVLMLKNFCAQHHLSGLPSTAWCTFSFSCDMQMKHLFIYCVIYSFTLGAAETKVGEGASSMKCRSGHLIRPCLSADRWFSSSPPAELRMSVCLGGLVPVCPALLSTVCGFTLLSNGRRQMLVAAHDLQMSYMATELESAANATAQKVRRISTRCFVCVSHLQGILCHLKPMLLYTPSAPFFYWGFFLL